MPLCNSFFSSSNRGPLAEWVVQQIVEYWKKKGKIWDYIIDKHLDAIGIDIIIIMRGGLAVPLQIKSSTKHAREHLKHYPTIPFLFVVENFPSYEGDLEPIKREAGRLKMAVNDFIKYALGGGSRSVY